MTRAFTRVWAHWINSAWERKFAALNCKQLSGRRSNEMKARKFETVLADWSTPKESCQAVILDNAANRLW